MPVEQHYLFYKGLQRSLKVLILNYDYGKYNSLYYIREIDNILDLNSSKLKSGQINNIRTFAMLKSSIGDNFYEEEDLELFNRAIKKLSFKNNKHRNNNDNTNTQLENQKIVRYNITTSNNNDDDDELIIDEYGVLDYYYKLANKKKHPDFIDAWRLFIDIHIRTPNNILKIGINRACVDVTSKVKLEKKMLLDYVCVEYILFAQTQTMMKDNLYLITSTCDYQLTLTYLNQVSVENYYATVFVPVENVDRVYVELLTFIDDVGKHHNKASRLKQKSKIFHIGIDLFPLILGFVEARRTCKEFVQC